MAGPEHSQAAGQSQSPPPRERPWLLPYVRVEAALVASS
jgi:hypothetical protein